ncbi:phage portal protein [Paraglaciecola sp.]|uniref:phage portal protein n=1 Tax=Paraglaciecola sp. TaxID=1920173 RepID=UPI003EF628E0
MNIFNRVFGKKEAVVIDSSEKLASFLGSWYDTSSGVSITPANALQLISVYQCVRVLAESVGMLPLSMMKEEGAIKEKAIDHNLHKLFTLAPNDYMTAQEWKELVIAHLCLRGNHYSFINRTRKGVSELLPLAPDSVTPKLNDSYQVEYKVKFKNGTVKTLDKSQVFHVKLFSIDGVNGLSPISQARHSLGLAKAAETHGASVFKNGAKPAGGYKTPGNLSDEQYNTLKTRMEDHQGSGNEFKPFILEGGLDWVQVSITPEDAQLLDTRKFQRSEIAGLFRVPPHKIGDLEKATFSNIEHQGLEFVTDSLMPYLTRIENRIRTSLLTGDDWKTYFAKFNVNALLRGDMKARAEFYTKLEQAGALSPNEIRAKEDMNPREGGDIYLTPMNMNVNGKKPEEEADDDKT